MVTANWARAPKAADSAEAELANKPALQIEEGNGEKVQFGLTRDQLITYSKNPFWATLRWSLVVVFWLVWFGMLAAAILIIIYGPKCPNPGVRAWWEAGPIYRIDVRKFYDSNGDGVGDLAGLESKLDYIVAAGMNSILLSAFYKTPGKAKLNYDISDHKEVDTLIGNLSTWRSLIAAAREHNIKVVVDLVPNHSSDEHPWFLRSAERAPGYEDYYVWRAGANPPNSWKSVDGGPGWSKHEKRGEWFLHNYAATQPDLNLENPKVMEELQSVMEFWLGEGVDGFNIDSVNLLIEDFDSNKGNKEKIKDVVRRLRGVLDRASSRDGQSRVLISLTGLPLADTAYLYGNTQGENGRGDLIQLPVGASILEGVSSPPTASSLKEWLETYIRNLPSQAWPAFILSPSKDRIGTDLVDPLNMLSLLLPATPLPLFGDELGLQGESMDWNQAMEYRFQQLLGAQNKSSHFNLYSNLAKLRTQETVLMGTFNAYTFNNTFVLTRIKKGNPGYLLAINFNSTGSPQQINATSLPNIPQQVKLMMSSGIGEEGRSGELQASQLRVGPTQAILFTFTPTF